MAYRTFEVFTNQGQSALAIGIEGQSSRVLIDDNEPDEASNHLSVTMDVRRMSRRDLSQNGFAYEDNIIQGVLGSTPQTDKLVTEMIFVENGVRYRINDIVNEDLNKRVFLEEI